MNIKVIHGRLTRDPELTKGEEKKNDRVKFTVATDRRYGDETDFHDCILFGARAEVIHKFFHKGSEIVLYGEDQQNKYTDKNGNKRTSWTVKVEDFDFCGSKSNGSDTQQTAPADEPNPEGFEEIEEEIPF